MLANQSINQINALDHILDATSVQQLHQYMDEMLHYLSDFFKRDQFYSGISIETLQKKIDTVKDGSDANLNIHEMLASIKDLYLNHTIAFHHSTYIAHLNCPILIPAILGDTIATIVNTAIETWDQSTSGTLIEQELIQWICQAFQLPTESSDGIFTSGGTQSNFMALLMARDHYAFHEMGINIKQNGFSNDIHRFRIFCSEKAHYSIKKNAALLGLGYDAVIPVAVDEAFRMDTKALELAIVQELEQGNIPIAVVATTGTTDFGSIDPVETISTIAKKHKMWLHVDGAYGGCFVFTNSHQQRLDAVKYADSVTIDFHKTFFQPVCSSAFLVRNKDCFKYVSYYADYLNPKETKDAAEPNLVAKSIQTTRRFDALKLWFTKHMVGAETIAGFLETVHERANDAYQLLKAAQCFEVLHEPELSTVVFRYKIHTMSLHPKAHDAVNLYIKKKLFSSGQASVASTKVNGVVYLKFTLLNPKTTVEDLEHIISLIVQQGNLYYNKN